MKRSAIALVTLSLLVLAGTASAVATLPAIGLFNNSSGDNCYAIGVAAGSNRTYAFAVCVKLGEGPGDVTSITGAHFKVSNMPVLGTGDFLVLESWLGDTNTGGIYDASGVTVMWELAQPGPVVHLGNFILTDSGGLNPFWPTPHAVYIDGYDGVDADLIVYDENGDPHVVNGWEFRLNDTDDPVFDCTDNVTPVSESTWSTIKQLY